MTPPSLVLGDYYQLLLKKGQLAAKAPLRADLTRRVSMVSCDSQTVTPGALFVCKGAAFREEYLEEAVRKGAFAYVSEREYPQVPGGTWIPVKDVRTAMGLLADLAWGHPSGKLKVIGLTGTKGKTTTAYYLKAILDAWGEESGGGPAAILSSIITDDGVERRPSKLTTPEPLELQQRLFHALSAGREYVVMEVSSQALKYGRVLGTEFAAGAFLNIGEDHVSPIEHPSFEDYFAAKKSLFTQTSTAVVNLDADLAEEILEASGACRQLVSFSRRRREATVYGSHLTKWAGGSAFRVDAPWWSGELRLPMGGDFNVENALAAAAVAGAFGVSLSAVRTGLEGAAVPGRMETLRSADGAVSVVVDYAHNGMSLEALLKAVREEYPGREVTVVFGCTGGKALDRREGMGRAAGALADRIILTEDDPGREPVEEICREIGSYITPGGKPWEIVPDRAAAVEKAVAEAGAPAVVVLAGKGAEIAQKRGTGSVPYPGDALLARKALNDYDRGRA